MAFSKDVILDAAEKVAAREGIAGLTLDAVAQQAGASKGGLMHHFRSKDALLEGMVGRIVDNWRAEYTKAIEGGGGGAGSASRGVIGMAFGDSRAYTEACRRSSVVLIAALVNNPKLIRPVREAYQQLYDRLERDGQRAGVDEVVMLALHGLWFEWMFGLRGLTAERTKRVHDVLMGLLKNGAAGNGGVLRRVARGGTRSGKIKSGTVKSGTVKSGTVKSRKVSA